MTMDADECHSGLDLASWGTVPKLPVRQLASLIGIYMSSPSVTSYLLQRRVTTGLDCFTADGLFA